MEERETRVIDAFVELSDSLVNGYDLSDFLQRLVEHCLELLGAEAGGVLLHHHGQLRVLASSSEDMETLELFELQSEQGPCFDAYHSGEEIAVEHLADHIERWPSFVPEATGRGWVSAYAVPLRLRDDRVGALNLFSSSPRTLDDADRNLARGLADIATIAILQERTVADVDTARGQLREALDSRVVIEQAKGRVAENCGLGMQEAFDRLRGHARARNVRLRDVARQIVEGDLGADDLNPPEGPRT